MGEDEGNKEPEEAGDSADGGLDPANEPLVLETRWLRIG